MTTLNGFGVSISEAQEETSENYIVLRHGQTFSLRLHNGHKENGKCIPADAEVYVQGKYCGTFRVAAGQTIRLERPLNDDGKFTAYRNNTYEAKQAEIDPNSFDNGLIKVVWKPGREQIDFVRDVYRNVVDYPRIEWSQPPYYHIDWNYNNPSTTEYQIGYDYNTTNCNTTNTVSYKRSCHSNDGLVGGGVGLSGHSNQSFNEVQPLDYTDQETTIHIRIAFRDDGPRPIKAVHKIVYESKAPRPLK